MSQIKTERNLKVFDLLLVGRSERWISQHSEELLGGHIRPSMVSKLKRNWRRMIRENTGVSARSLPKKVIPKRV